MADHQAPDFPEALPAREWLETIFEHANDAIFVLDLERDAIVEANPQACDIVGYSREELLETSISAIHPGEVEEFKAFVEEAAEEGHGWSDEFTCRRKDDRRVPCEISASRVKADGQTYLLAHVRGISKHKREEQLRAEQNRLLELIASGTPLDECLSALCEAVPQLSPGVRASILLANDEDTSFRRPIAPDLLSSWGDGLEDAPINDLMIGTCGKAVFRDEPMVFEDVANDDRWSKEWRDLCVANSVLASYSVPIPGEEGDPLGAFMLCFDEPRVPNAWEEQLAEFGTHVASIALEHDRSRRALQQSKDQLAAKAADMERLHTLSTRLLRQESVEAALHEVMEASAELLGADKASTQIYDNEEDVLRLVSVLDFDQEFIDQFRVVNTGSITTCAAALKQREQVLVEDLAADPGYAEFYQTVMRYDARAAFSTPLYDSSGQLLGMFTMYWEDPHRPAEDELKLLDLYTQQAARQVERERSRQALRESEERFRAFVTASSDVVYRMSPDWTEMHYLEGRDFIADTHEPSRTWIDKYIHPDDQQQVMEAIDEAIRTESTFELEHRVLRADDTLGWTFSRAIPILDEDGEIIEWFGTATDITERKEADAKLARVTAEIERQKRFYETVISSTPDLMCAFDLNYRFTFVNDALLKMWGRTREESIGKTLQEVGYEPWHAEMHKREIDKVIATKQPIRGEVAFPHATLGERIYDYIFVPVLDDEDEVEAVVGTTRDITERKKAEEALKEAKEEAEKTARLRSNLLANVSHEIRTPITGILGLAESLEDKVAEPRREEVRLIEKSGRRLMDTFDSVLALAQLEGNEIEVDTELLDVTGEIEEIAGSLRPLAAEKGLALEVTSSAPAAKCHLDSALLGRIINNLVSNAIKFTNEGKVSIEVSASEEEVSLAISDTGVGIGEEFQSRLFEEFTQESTGFSRTHEGIGLGLALTKKMTEQLGGEISVESEKGQGSTFTVTFPRASSASEESEEDLEAPADELPANGSGAPTTSVLLIEDNAIIRQVTVERLGQRHGYEVEAFEKAKPALKRAEEETFDVVLIDISLPGIDGVEALRKFRSTAIYRDRPIIAVTGHALPGDRERFLDEGFSEHIGKPFSADELAEKMRTLDT